MEINLENKTSSFSFFQITHQIIGNYKAICNVAVCYKCYLVNANDILHNSLQFRSKDFSNDLVDTMNHADELKIFKFCGVYYLGEESYVGCIDSFR